MKLIKAFLHHIRTADCIQALADAGYRVIALDLPPFGYSQRPENQRYDRPAQAARILGLLDALELDQVVLVGHSFGGGPTLEAALMAPERVTRLALVAAAISLDSAGADPGALGWVGETPWARETAVACTFHNPLVTYPVLRAMVHDPATASPDRVALYQQPFAVRGSTEAVGAWVPELLAPGAAWSPDRDRIRAFEPPVRLIWGLQDAVTPPSQAEELNGLFPHSDVAWLDGVGHVPQIERVDAFHEALLPFLAAESR